MRKILATGVLFVSMAVLASCGSSKSDTTGQLFNDTVFGGSGYTARLTIGGTTLSSFSGVWSSKTKLANCGSNQSASFVDPGGTTWTWSSLTISCNKHNLITLGFNSSTGNARLSIEEGSEK